MQLNKRNGLNSRSIIKQFIVRSSYLPSQADAQDKFLISTEVNVDFDPDVDHVLKVRGCEAETFFKVGLIFVRESLSKLSSFLAAAFSCVLQPASKRSLLSERLQCETSDSSGLTSFYFSNDDCRDVAMTTILIEAGMQSNMASDTAQQTTVKSEPNYDSVRQTLCESIR